VLSDSRFTFRYFLDYHSVTAPDWLPSSRKSRHHDADVGRENLIATCIKQFYLVREQPSMAALLQEMRRRFAERQLRSPNYRTVVRRIAALDARFVMRERQGLRQRGRSLVHRNFQLSHDKRNRFRPSYFCFTHVRAPTA
jgi:hypothetical protein